MLDSETVEFIRQFATVHAWHFQNASCAYDCHCASCFCPEKNQLDEVVAFAERKDNLLGLLELWDPNSAGLLDAQYAPIQFDSQNKLLLTPFLGQSSGTQERTLDDEPLWVAASVIYINAAVRVHNGVDDLRPRLAFYLAIYTPAHFFTRIYLAIKDLAFQAKSIGRYDSLRGLPEYKILESLSPLIALLDDKIMQSDNGIYFTWGETTKQAMDDILNMLDSLAQCHRLLNNQSPIVDNQAASILKSIAVSNCQDISDLLRDPNAENSAKDVVDVIKRAEPILENSRDKGLLLDEIEKELHQALVQYICIPAP